MYDMLLRAIYCIRLTAGSLLGLVGLHNNSVDFLDGQVACFAQFTICKWQHIPLNPPNFNPDPDPSVCVVIVDR